MAGIGLRLNKVVAKGSYLQAVSAYLSSVVISAGPWLTAVIALTLLGSAAVAFLGKGDRALLVATITYAFSISLAVTGGAQMVITRYLADRLYADDQANLAPTCTAVLVGTTPLVVLATPFLLLAPFDLRYRLLSISLFLVLSMIWMMVIFLSAVREYLRILFIFVLSYASSVFAAIQLGQAYGVLGGLAGFTAGQVLCLGLLVAQIYSEFAPNIGLDFGFVRYFQRYWDLALIGTCFSVGIWADNAIYWYSSQGQVVAGFFHLNPAYDSAKLIAYLVTIPASAYFIVHLEVNFYRHYRDFYTFIRDKGTLAQISEAKDGMVEAAQAGLTAIVSIQVLVGAAVFFLAPHIAAVLFLPPEWVRLLRVAVLAVSCQFVMLMIVLLLLYLDHRRATLRTVATFAIGNVVLTVALLHLGSRVDGMGYLLMALAALFIGLFALYRRLNSLEYLTFMSQPMQE